MYSTQKYRGSRRELPRRLATSTTDSFASRRADGKTNSWQQSHCGFPVAPPPILPPALSSLGGILPTYVPLRSWRYRRICSHVCHYTRTVKDAGNDRDLPAGVKRYRATPKDTRYRPFFHIFHRGPEIRHPIVRGIWRSRHFRDATCLEWSAARMARGFRERKNSTPCTSRMRV